jgi:hypothetical protein
MALEIAGQKHHLEEGTDLKMSEASKSAGEDFAADHGASSPKRRNLAWYTRSGSG